MNDHTDIRVVARGIDHTDRSTYEVQRVGDGFSAVVDARGVRYRQAFGTVKQAVEWAVGIWAQPVGVAA